MIYDYEILLYNGLVLFFFADAVQKWKAVHKLRKIMDKLGPKVILKDNKIQEVSIDETVADVDKTKKQLQNSYGMNR